ncbi:MAG: hypothetical protein LBK99_19970, partial [Opitutaceae bacterium]|nr:hypothetical protein [Opitutaceae bacterium]
MLLLPLSPGATVADAATQTDKPKFVLTNLSDLGKVATLNTNTNTNAVELLADSLVINTVKIDTTKPFVPLATKPGLLKPDTDYTVRLTYKLTPGDISQLPYLKLVATDGKHQWRDITRHLGASKPDSFVKMNFRTPPGAPNSIVKLEANG